MYDISEALKSVRWSVDSIPPLGNAARQLLEMSGDDRKDARLLGLVAQQDPVLLGKILAGANSAAVLPAGSKLVTNVDAGIRALGVTRTFAILFATSLDSVLIGPHELGAIRRYLVKNSFTRWNTARGLARFLALGDDQTFVLQLACLLEPLGIYAALLQKGEIAEHVKGRVAEAVQNRLPACSPAWGVAGYAEVSSQIAAAWGAPSRVVLAIAGAATADGRLVRSVDQLLRAKLVGESQIAALRVVLADDVSWDEQFPSEIDLVRFE